MTGLEDILTSSIVHRVGCMLLHALWQGTAVGALLAGAMWMLRRQSANLRYAIACAALLLMLALPGVTIWLVPPASPAEEQLGLAALPAETELRLAPPGHGPFEPVGMQPTDETIEVAADSAEAAVSPAVAGPVAAAPPSHERAGELLAPALPWLVCGWLIGVTGLSGWHLRGWLQVRRLRRVGTRPVAEAVRRTLRRMCRRLGVDGAVAVLESVLVRVPTVIGWLRPVVLLPAQALTGLTAEQLEAVLAHELAHVRRHDYLVNLLQTVAETLLFYHPAVWWTSRRIRAERENCCDDLAVTAYGKPLAYAQALTAVARHSLTGRRLAVAADGGSFLARIRRIVGLPTGKADHRLGWLAGALAMLTVLAIVVGMSISAAADKPPATQPAGAGAAAEQLQRLWVALGSGDPKEASQAVQAMVALGDRAVAFLAKRFEPAPADAGRVKALVAKLDDAKYAVRKEAYDELMQLGRAALPILKEALKQPKLSVEARARIKGVVTSWTGAAQDRRCERAALAVAQIGGPKASAMLARFDQKGWGPWGEAVEGMQVRLRAHKSFHNAGVPPRLSLDARNLGKRNMRLLLIAPQIDIELDGVWYAAMSISYWAHPADYRIEGKFTFGPGKRWEDIGWSPRTPRYWVSKGGKPLGFGPGKHRIRLAVTVLPTVGKGAVRLISSVIELRPADHLPKEKATPPATQPGGKESVEKDLQRLWVALGSTDSKEASQAVKAMVALGDRAVTFLAGRFEPAPADAGHVKALVAKLDDAKYAVRKKAYDELMQLGRAALPALKEALKQSKLSVDARARINEVVKNWTSPPAGSAQRRRFDRMLQALERIGTARSKGLLARLGREGWFPWGEAAEGIRMRLRPAHFLRPDGWPNFFVDFRNNGKREVTLVLRRDHFGLQINGVWYSARLAGLGRAGRVTLSPGKEHHGFSFRPAAPRDWRNDKNGPLAPVMAGRHTFRLAFTGVAVEDAPGKFARVTSNLLEVSIPPPAPNGPSTQPADPKVTVRKTPGSCGYTGRIIDDETGKPVERYVIRIGWTESPDAREIPWYGTLTPLGRSSRGGRFRVDETIEPDKKRKYFYFRIFAAGYVPQLISERPISKPLKISGVIVRLKRGRRLKGRVLDHAGKAVADATLFPAGRPLRLRLINGQREEGYVGSSCKTGKDGRFELAGVGKDTTHVLVSAASLHAWLVRIPKADKDWTIKLPQPATVIVNYDIPGAPDPAHVRLALTTWEMPEWRDLRVEVKLERKVANKGRVVLKNVTPGLYDVSRELAIHLGAIGIARLSDRRMTKFESGKTTRVDFVREAGTAIIGEIPGLGANGCGGAFISVLEPGLAKVPQRRRDAAILDHTYCGPDGKFRTSRIPPGRYVVVVQSHPMSRPGEVTAIRRGRFSGSTEVTIPADGGPVRVRILMRPRDEDRGAATGPVTEQLTPAALARLWQDLAAGDYTKASRASAALARGSKGAATFLTRRLLPGPVDAARIKQLLAQLDSPQYKARQKARAELAALGLAALPALREAQGGRLSAAAASQAKALLARQPALLSRLQRAVAVLERLDSRQCLSVLRTLAKGDPAAPETKLIKAELDFFLRRHPLAAPPPAPNWPATQPAAEATWGPAIERVVAYRKGFPSKAVPEPGPMYLDLDTGAHVEFKALPTSRMVGDAGVDVCYWPPADGAGMRLATSNMQVQPLSDGWNSSPRQVWRALLFGSPYALTYPGRSTLAFMTRDGGLGILHILGFTKDRQGIRIRYKLAQRPKAGRLKATPPARRPADTPATQPGGKAAVDDRLQRLWVALGSADPKEASQAVEAMVALGDKAVAFLAERFEPGPVDAGHVGQLIAKLDDAKYAVRKKAYDELADMGLVALSALRRASKDNGLSLAARSSVETLLEGLTGRPPDAAGARRLARAVEVLRQIGTAPARGMLIGMARGGPREYLAKAAQAATAQWAYQEYWEASRFLCAGGSRQAAAKRFASLAERHPHHPRAPTASELARLLAEMAKEDAKFREPKDPAKVSGDQRIRYLAHKLRDVQERAVDVPSKVRVLFSPKTPNSAAVALRRMGKVAVPALLDLLGDRRPTRSRAEGVNGDHVLRQCDVALEILEVIAARRFDRPRGRGAYLANATEPIRKQIISRVKNWWQASRSKTESQWVRESLSESGIGAMWDRLEFAERVIELEGSKSVSFFRDRFRAEPDSAHIIRLLWKAGRKAVLEDVRSAVSAKNLYVRAAAYRVLLEAGEKGIVDAAIKDLTSVLDHPKDDYRRSLLGVLAQSGREKGLLSAARLIRHADPGVARDALSAILMAHRAKAGPAPQRVRLILPYVAYALNRKDLPTHMRYWVAQWMIQVLKLPISWPDEKSPGKRAAVVEQVKTWWAKREDQYPRVSSTTIPRTPPATQPATGGSPGRPGGKAVADDRLRRLWVALGSADPKEADKALEAMAALGDRAVAFLAERLYPPPADAGRVKKLIAKLDDADYAVRKKAREELMQLGRSALPALKKALRQPKLSVEARIRIEGVVKNWTEPAPGTAQARRFEGAVGALVEVGGARTKGLLARLAKEGWYPFLNVKGQRLTLKGAHVTNVSLSRLGGLRLRSLMLYKAAVTDEGLARLAKLHSLKKLYLRTMPGIKGPGLARLKEIHGLESLELWGTSVGEQSLVHLVGMQSLRELSVPYMPLTEAGLAQLGKMTNLRRLNLYGCPVTDAALAKLAPLTKLEGLDLSHTQVTDAGLARLRAFGGLKELHVGNHGVGQGAISDAGVAHLAALVNLEELYLVGRTAITSKGVKHLAGLKRLRSLSLVGTNAGGHALKEIRDLPELKTLWLKASQAETGIEHLKAMKKLSRLWLFGGRPGKVNLQRLKDALPPGCNIGMSS